MEKQIVNICGQKVTIKKISRVGKTYFCAYVDLEKSEVLSDSFLGYPTYREGIVVGVDTAQNYNEYQTLDEKLMSAMHQIERIIKSWKSAVKEGYYSEDN